MVFVCYISFNRYTPPSYFTRHTQPKVLCKTNIPPKAVPFQTRPVISWNGRVDISFPAPATPMIVDTPQPLWHDSKASRWKENHNNDNKSGAMFPLSWNPLKYWVFMFNSLKVYILKEELLIKSALQNTQNRSYNFREIKTQRNKSNKPLNKHFKNKIINSTKFRHVG